MKIFHHNDNDGYAAASLVYNIFCKYKKYDVSRDDFISVNYNDRVPSKDLITEGEDVFIVDYSFTEETKYILYEIADKGGTVVWIDHHLSSVKVFKELVDTFTEHSNLLAKVDIRKSATKLVYEFYDKVIPYIEDLEDKTFTKIMELVNDYDMWIHEYPESMWFNIGSQMVPNHPMDDIWISDPTYIIEKGKVIKEYNDAKNNRLTKSHGYTININGHECIVLNTPEASSQAFADVYKDYNFAIRYVFNGTNYSYSIYSGLEDINCAEIAKYFNPAGGGHKGAAGFVSDNLLFVKGSKFVI